MDPSLSHPSRWSRARWAGPAGQSKGCGVPAGEITRQDKSLGLPEDLAAGTRLLGKTAQAELFAKG